MQKLTKSLPMTGIVWLCTTMNAAAQPERETVTQVSTIDALLNGVYDGAVSLREVTQYGDFGIGTFHALDGEMLMVDGEIYQIASDGVARVPDLNVTTPFAAVTFFEVDQSHILPSGMTFDVFEHEVDRLLPTPNIFYALRIEGVFKTMKTRSVPEQTHPYPPLTEIAKTQPVFEFENIEGVLIGFRCPPYVTGINVPGYHLHFLTKDRKAGGHVLAFTVDDAVLTMDYTSNFSMRLPVADAFYSANLEDDKTQELKAVEK